MKNKLIISLSILLAASGIAGCRKDMTDDQAKAFTEPRKAFVQWYNATVNSNRSYIYVNGVPQNGATVAYGSVFPSGAYSFAVYSGNSGVTIKDTATTTTQVPLNFTQDFQTDNSYTIFTYDVATAPKRLIVNNNTITYPSDNMARVRIVNLISGAPGTGFIDIWSANSGQRLYSNVPIAQATNFATIAPNTSDKWYVRLAGSFTNLDSLSISTTTLTPKKFYTAVYRGAYATATTRALNIFANN